VHYGSAGALKQLLQPFANTDWARQPYASGVAREALVLAALTGDASSCCIILDCFGPHVHLNEFDVGHALQAATEWESMCPGSIPALKRNAVVEVLRTAMLKGAELSEFSG